MIDRINLKTNQSPLQLNNKVKEESKNIFSPNTTKKSIISLQHLIPLQSQNPKKEIDSKRVRNIFIKRPTIVIFYAQNGGVKNLHKGNAQTSKQANSKELKVKDAEKRDSQQNSLFKQEIYQDIPFKNQTQYLQKQRIQNGENEGSPQSKSLNRQESSQSCFNFIQGIQSDTKKGVEPNKIDITVMTPLKNVDTINSNQKILKKSRNIRLHKSAASPKHRIQHFQLDGFPEKHDDRPQSAQFGMKKTVQLSNEIRQSISSSKLQKKEEDDGILINSQKSEQNVLDTKVIQQFDSLQNKKNSCDKEQQSQHQVGQQIRIHKIQITQQHLFNTINSQPQIGILGEIQSVLTHSNYCNPEDNADSDSSKEPTHKISSFQKSDSFISDDITIQNENSAEFPNTQIGELLGQGLYGKVYKGFVKSSGKFVAVKEINEEHILQDNPKSFLEDIYRDIQLLKELKHKNIVSYFGSRKIGEKSLYIYMEYMSGGSIAEMLKRFGPFEEKVIQKFVRQILDGLVYLHSQGVIHRDLKGANIFSDGQGIVKLADFGAARNAEGIFQYSQSQSMFCHSIKGSIYWMAPELIRNEKYGRKSDVWSLGCTIIEMAQAQHPWYIELFFFEESIIKFSDLAKEIIEEQPIPIPQHLSKECSDFILKCCTYNPQSRPSSSDLLSHAFLQKSYD